MNENSDGPEAWGNDAYYCDACNKPFRTPFFDISREYERTIFSPEPSLPEVEVIGASSIAQYCSDDCLAQSRMALLTREKVRATYPDIGPVESCSRCDAPVDMTTFHLAIVESETNQDWESMSASVIRVVTLAVVCNKCTSPPERLIAEVDNPVRQPVSTVSVRASN